MPLASDDTAQAVFVFSNNRITREMLYTEFEAILDGYVPIPEFATKQVRCVFTRINRKFCVIATVFFLIEFDTEGFPDRRWNVPLLQLADTAGNGPDLGAGSIRLACATQCPIDWHRPNLWDPDMRSGQNDFVLLKKAVVNNRIGVMFKKLKEDQVQLQSAQAAVTSKDAEVLKLKFEKEARDHVARLLKEQRFQMGIQKNQFQEQVDQLKSEHQSRLARYQEQLRDSEEQLVQLLASNQQLKEKLETQATKMAGIREYFEHKLKSAQAGEKDSFQSLHEQYEVEMQIKIEAAVGDLEEMVQMRDMELLYRNEQEASLNEEIARLRTEVQSLLNNSGDEILHKLQQQGINFVAYHPGAGHITIPVADLTRYTENPQDYAAEKCGLTAVQYKSWLAHFQSPSCCALKEGGSLCGAPIERVHNPKDFHPGENDRCNEHRTLQSQTFAVTP